MNWIPYLTTRLVDDAASHLRLFKQARTKMKLQESKSKAQNASPAALKDQKQSPRKTHKRNKSETDISWYPSAKSENKRDPEFVIGNSKLYGNEQKCLTLEDYFFDLECQMENNLICRDGVCADIATEKGKTQH